MRCFLYAMLVFGFLAVPVGAQAEQLTKRDREDAADIGVPASWMLTGFNCSSAYGCVQNKPVKKTPAQIREEAAADARAERREIVESGVKLRQLGMSPHAVQVAIRGSRRAPDSACSFYVTQLLDDYDHLYNSIERDGSGDSDGFEKDDDRRGYDTEVITEMEESGTCEGRNLKKPSPLAAPGKTKYDPAKDPHKITQNFFRDHHDEAIDFLVKIGVKKEIAERVSYLIVNDDPDSFCNINVGHLIEDAKRNDQPFYVNPDVDANVNIDVYDEVTSLNKSHDCRDFEFSRQ